MMPIGACHRPRRLRTAIALPPVWPISCRLSRAQLGPSSRILPFCRSTEWVATEWSVAEWSEAEWEGTEWVGTETIISAEFRQIPDTVWSVIANRSQPPRQR